MDIDFNSSNLALFKGRFKRFFVIVEPISSSQEFVQDEDGNYIAYCPNGGRMADILVPGALCVFSKYEGKLRWKWEGIQINGIWIGVNTNNPNKLIEKNLDRIFPGENFKREVTFGNYRTDFANNNKIIEVKHVHWKVGDTAMFPDCVTIRGARQLDDISKLIISGYECFVIYVLQRSDLDMVSLAAHIDEKYYSAHLKCLDLGLKILAFNCDLSLQGINLLNQIKFI